MSATWCVEAGGLGWRESGQGWGSGMESWKLELVESSSQRRARPGRGEGQYRGVGVPSRMVGGWDTRRGVW